MPRRKQSRRAAKPARKSLRPLVTVREAADFLFMTTSGVYAAIKRGDMAAKRVDGVWTLDRSVVREYDRKRREFFFRDPNRPLTDEEFIQRMWDNDPD